MQNRQRNILFKINRVLILLATFKYLPKFVKKSIRLIAKTFIPQAKTDTLVPTIFSYSLVINPVLDKVISKNIYFYGGYEIGTLMFIKKHLNEGDIFYDVGANLGLMTILASISVGSTGRVYGFEPCNEIFKKLSKNIKINKCNNVNLFKMGISSFSSKAKIKEVNSDNMGSMQIDLDKNGDIKVTSLDNLIKSKTIMPPDMIKVDTEGFELEVLKGARKLLLNYNPILIVEYTDTHAQKRGSQLDIYKTLLKHNYKIYSMQLGKNYYSKLTQITNENDLPQHDNLFCFKQ